MVHEFIVACKENDLNTIQQMTHMVDMNEGFIWACSYGHIDVVRYLVQNTNINIHARDEEGFIWACKNGHIDVVKYLVPLGVDIHAQYEEGFIWACNNGHIDVVRYLVQNTDINIHVRKEEGFRWACSNGKIDVVQYLVQNTDIDIHAICEEGLMWAWWSGHIDVVRYLVNFMQCVKYRKLNKISQFMPDTCYQWTRKNTYFINVGKYMNHLNYNFIL